MSLRRAKVLKSGAMYDELIGKTIQAITKSAVTEAIMVNFTDGSSVEFWAESADFVSLEVQITAAPAPVPAPAPPEVAKPPDA